MQAPHNTNSRQPGRPSHSTTNNGPTNVSAARPNSRDRANPSSLQMANNMLSQDSIQHYVEDAEKEAQKERKRLALQESERKQYANQIISQTSHNSNEHQPADNRALNQVNKFSFGKTAPKGKFGRQPTDGTSRKERLHELLEKTEQYTKFILQQNLMHHKE